MDHRYYIYDCVGEEKSILAESITKSPIKTARMKWFLKNRLSQVMEKNQRIRRNLVIFEINTYNS